MKAFSCSNAGPLLFLTPTLPSKAQQKVAAAVKRKKNTAVDAALLKKFEGGYPPSLLRVMSGECVAEGLGFHQLAMQIAITSNVLGKSEEAMLTGCAGLIANHQSDGSRYNTPEKRAAELKRMHQYTLGNPCYAFSVGALKTLLPQGTATPDLSSLPAEAGEVTGDGENADGSQGGVTMAENGMFAKTKEAGMSVPSTKNLLFWREFGETDGG